MTQLQPIDQHADEDAAWAAVNAPNVAVSAFRRLLDEFPWPPGIRAPSALRLEHLCHTTYRCSMRRKGVAVTAVRESRKDAFHRAFTEYVRECGADDAVAEACRERMFKRLLD